jgi:hypothetical protein
LSLRSSFSPAQTPRTPRRALCPSSPAQAGRFFSTHLTCRLLRNRLPGTRPFPRWRWFLQGLLVLSQRGPIGLKRASLNAHRLINDPSKFARFLRYGGEWSTERLAMGPGPCRYGRRRRWRDALFEVPFGRSRERNKFAEPSSEMSLGPHPSLEQKRPSTSNHPVCGYGEHKRPTGQILIPSASTTTGGCSSYTFLRGRRESRRRRGFVSSQGGSRWTRPDGMC